MDTPLRTVPGGAADGRDGVSVGVPLELEVLEAEAEAEAYVRVHRAARKVEHEARAVRAATVIMLHALLSEVLRSCVV